MLAHNVRVDVARVDIQVLTEHVLEAGGVQNGTGADDVALGQAGHLDGGIGEDVNGIGDDQQDTRETALADLRDDALEDGDVLVHQVKTGLAGLLRGAGGDDDDRGIGNIGIVAGVDLHGATERHAMRDIEGLSLGAVAVHIDKDHLGKEARLHEGERGGRAHESAADDSHLAIVNHLVSPSLWVPDHPRHDLRPVHETEVHEIGFDRL